MKRITESLFKFLLTLILLINAQIHSFGQESVVEYFSLIRETPDSAITLFEKSIVESEELESKALATYGLAISLNHIGKIDTAFHYFDRSFQLFDSAGIDSMAFESLFEKGINCRRSGRYILALENYQRAYQYASDRKLPVLMGDALNAIGVAYYQQGETVKALEYYLNALLLFEELGKREKMGKSYNNIGVIYKISSNYDKAIEYYQKSIDIKKEFNNIKALDPPYYNINDLYHIKEEYQKALKTTKEAMEIAREHDLEWWIQSCHYTLALDYEALGKLDSMRFHVLEYRKMAYDTYFEAISDELELKYYLAVGNADSAIHFGRKAIEFFRSDGDLRHFNRCMTLYANVKMLEGNFQEAIDTLLQVKRAAESRNDNAQIISILSELSSAYEKAGNYREALKYSREYNKRRKAVYNESRASIIGGMEAETQLRIREKEKKLLKKESELQSAIIDKQHLMIIFSTSGIVFTILLMFFIYRAQIQRRRLAESRAKVNEEKSKRISEQLEYKNRELENFALQIVHKNEFLTEVSNEIEKWYKNGMGQNVKVRDLFKKLKANSVLINNQKEFEAHVNSVHESFYEKLDKEFPELSANEKRLAALLRMNLSSKEISSIIGISAKSVDMNRYRLRKKLNLEAGEDLVEVLNSV